LRFFALSAWPIRPEVPVSRRPQPSPSTRLNARPGTPFDRLVVLLASLALAIAACTGGSGPASPSLAPSSPPIASPTGVPTPAPTDTPAPSAAFPTTLTDDEGTAVQLAAEPQRIVSLTPAATEILFALGAGSRVVATTDFDDYPPEAVDLPDVASYTTVDVEKVVGLEADVVIAGGNFFNPPEAIARLRSLGVPVVVVYAPNLRAVLDDIELIGAAVGLSEAAAEMTGTMQAGFDAVAEAAAPLTAPRTFYELDATSAIYTAADGSFIEEMLRLAGGDPITTGSTTDFAIPLEKLIEADPELILLGDAAYGVTPEQVSERTGWKVMTAVKNGAIRPVNDLIVTRPGPRLVQGLRELALAIHPDLVLPSAAPIPPVP
jgi:iron complex transport system substrate-binding protein